MNRSQTTNRLPSFSTLSGEKSLLREPLSENIILCNEKDFLNGNENEGNRGIQEQEECIEFIPVEEDDGEIEPTVCKDGEADDDTETTSVTDVSSPESPPFAPGDHVYQWCKVAGIPAFHHHAVVMQVYWDEYDDLWMLHVSDFSNISLYDASAQAARRRGGRNNNKNATTIDDGRHSASSFFANNGSNPFVRNSTTGSWRSYATPATRWRKVIYQATMWQSLTNPCAGTCTRAECDPPGVVQARVQFLQLHSATLLADKPYHWLYNNCEAAAVWCKTGEWCTLQALTVLATAAAGQAKSTALLAGGAAATQVTVTVPAAGILGFFGGTTTTQLPLLVSQPYLIPVLAAYGLITVGVPAIMIHNAKREWNAITRSLNDQFWADYALERPEVFVEYIRHYQKHRRSNETSTPWRKTHEMNSPSKQGNAKSKSTKSNGKPRLSWGWNGSQVATILLIIQGCIGLSLASSSREIIVPVSCVPESLFGVTSRPRGGAISTKHDVSYQMLAKVVEDKFSEMEFDDASPITKLTKTLSQLAGTQQTFKSLDGVAHEAYQRTHAADDISDVSVSGRAQRSAARLAAVAEALYACELIEMVQRPDLPHNETLEDKQLVLNITAGRSHVTLAGNPMPVVVMFEPLYTGGAGLDHGTMLSLTGEKGGRPPPNGRLLIVLGNPLAGDLVKTLQILDEAPLRIRLSSGLVTEEVASVQPSLYRAAGQLLTLLEPQLRHFNTSAIHFVGHSLAGGVASLAATMLDGSIGMPKSRTKKSKRGSRKKKSAEMAEVAAEATQDILGESDNSTFVQQVLEPLNGLGRARSSALTLGSPPSLSSNVVAAFCTSVVYGDDIVSRTTQETIEKLVQRMKQHISGGFLMKKLGWMSDTFSMAASSLQSHAHGSEGEEVKLSIPGRAYLVRPRRLANICSIHEFGNLKKGGREALREAFLWQMHDVLLSKSMWKHHSLESYIQGFARVQLRGVAADDDMRGLE
jgi:hypothetical protein